MKRSAVVPSVTSIHPPLATPALAVLLLLAGLLVLLPATGRAGEELLPPGRVPDIDAFMQIGAAYEPRMSRDGSALFFLSSSTGVSEVYRIDRGTGWPHQLTVFTEGVDFYSLSPKGDYLICGVGVGGDENSQLWLVDARTGRTEALTALPKVRHGSPSWTSDGATIFYNSNEANGKDFYIYRMRLPTREKSLLAEIPGWNTAGDVSDDDRRLLVGHADSNTNTDYHLIDLASGERTHITPHEGEVVYDAAQFDRTGERVYLVSNGNREGLSRRAVLDVATKKITFLDTSGVWEVESLAISPGRDVMGWTVNEDGYSRLHLRDLARERDLPVPPLDGQIGGAAFTAGSAVAFSFSSATNTSDVWVWDWQKPELVKMTHATYAGVDPASFVAPRLVRYKSFDGREIPAFLYLPPGYKPGTPVPFVIDAHGGPESQFRPGFIRHFQYLLLNGYGLLAPNPRGSTGYGKAYVDLDNYKKRLDSVKDYKAGADFLIREGYSRPGMLAVKGASYGGYMTLACVTEFPGFFSAAIDEVGIANFVTFLQNTAAYRRALREAEYGPLSDPAFLESISPLHKAGKITTPLLVVHGANDPRVPVGEARQIFQAIRASGGVADTLVFADEGHGVSKRPNVLVYYRRMVEFLDRHLKGGKEGAAG